MRESEGTSADADRATAAEPKVSALRDGIPSAGALFAVAEDLIALAEYAYDDYRDRDDADIEDAYCDTDDGLCGWGVCQNVGCIIDKYHRGLALHAQAIEARSATTAWRGPKDESAVGGTDAPDPTPTPGDTHAE